MILRIDKIAVPLPVPESPDPNGAAAVQELIGVNFGEMSTLMNFSVGMLETRVFHPDSGEVEFNAFIGEDYAGLVDERTLSYKRRRPGPESRRRRRATGRGTLESILPASVTFTEPAEKHLQPKPLPGWSDFRSLCWILRGTQAQVQSHSTLLTALRRQSRVSSIDRGGFRNINLKILSCQHLCAEAAQGYNTSNELLWSE
jgi:hypothetical protein